MIEYAIVFGILAGIIALYLIISPLAKKHKLEAIFAITAKAAEIVEQETKRPENETEEERQARHKAMKENAIKAAKEIAEYYNIKTPSDEILGYGVEAGVLLVNQVKKMTNKAES